MRRSSLFQWILSAAFASCLLVGCDTRPRDGFAEEIEQIRASDDGNQYALLSRVPRVHDYEWWPETQKRQRAGQTALELRDLYVALLGKLDADETITLDDGVKAACRKSFDLAARYSEPEPASEGDAARRTDPRPDLDLSLQITQSLVSCRDALLSLEAAGASREQRPAISLMKRFSSSGMSLVALTVMGHGDIDHGLALWREADSLVGEDVEGFKLSLRSLRGY